jgi:hypothetical protein
LDKRSVSGFGFQRRKKRAAQRMIRHRRALAQISRKENQNNARLHGKRRKAGSGL